MRVFRHQKRSGIPAIHLLFYDALVQTLSWSRVFRNSTGFKTMDRLTDQRMEEKKMI